MMMTRFVARFARVGVALGALGLPCLAQSFEKMDETWTVMVNGQSVRVEADGSFTIPNVSAPDQFGAGGPGTSPDFVSDDFLRVIGISTAGGTTRYAYSDRFRFRRGQRFSVGMMTISNSPPPFPQAIRIQSSAGLLEVGQSRPVQVIGRLLDGSEIDVTMTGTTYKTSNQTIATVNESGLVTATGPGTVLITALNEGATAVHRIQTTSSIRQTTVTGLVHLEDGSSVSGATVRCSFGETATTGEGGFFQVVCSLPSEVNTISVSASATVGGMLLTGNSGILVAIAGGFTDAGIIVLGRFVDRILDSPDDFSGLEALVDPEILPFGTLVSNQFAGQGVLFQLDDGNVPNVTTCAFAAGGIGCDRQFEPPGDACLSNFPFSCCPNMAMDFNPPRNRVGFEILTNEEDDLDLSLICIKNGQVIGTQFFVTRRDAFLFFGVESSLSFDRVIVDVTQVVNGAFIFDNLRFE